MSDDDMKAKMQKVMYGNNKRKGAGSKCICPICDKIFFKIYKRQAFCASTGPYDITGRRTLCKNTYWNNQKMAKIRAEKEKMK